ncbi:kynureninase [Temperatibacter marinus]|uniref:Kynureninase n=1 Tax=Temperatibacter marinus TaxID=1456591 RepID=A0AA52HBA5_9PROT|nr:kynureninase [Temperatibacter marinus]WND03443.1 kynureninase [Temperatibacter marinus]
MITLEECRKCDQSDSLASKKALFNLPEGVIYLDGNSLGAQPKSVVPRMQTVLSQEWATGLVKSWNDANWVTLPLTVGQKIAPLIGAVPESVIATDSTSLNVFKCVAAACALNKGRRKILSEPGNFPTDLYMLDGLEAFMQGDLEVVIKPREELLDAIDEETACVLLTHVHYISAEMWDMKAMTAAAHEKGALMVWDLSHSTGAVPLSLDDCEVDFALGCGYKYLNGGPGAPAFAYINKRHLGSVKQPLSGWFSHKRPFDFVDDFEGAPDIRVMQVGTPVVSAMALLDEALSLWEDVDLKTLREKSLDLTDLFSRLMDDQLTGYGFTAVTPRNRSTRGSHITYRHPDGYAIIQALIDRGVIGDFRAPDHLRFGVTPLYVGYEDIYQAVMILKDIMSTQSYKQDKYTVKNAVT